MNKYVVYYQRNGNYYKVLVHADNSSQAMLKLVDFYKYRVEVIMFFIEDYTKELNSYQFEKENNVILETDIK